MKLLDITEFYSPLGGGVRTYLAAKTRWIAGRENLQHAIVVSSDRTAVEMADRSRVYHLRGPAVPGSPGYHFLLGRRRVARIIERERPDVVEVGSPFFAPWHARAAAGRVGAATVGVFHSDERTVWLRHALRRAPRAVVGLADHAISAYLRAVHRSYDATVVTSPNAQASLAEIGVAATQLIPFGVDTELFRPDRRDPAWRTEVGAPPGATIALYVGRFSTEKNLDVVMRAVPQLSESGAYAVLMGEGHQRPRLEALARRYPQCLRVLAFEPDRSPLARAYASADLFVAPCPFETFGLAALEAMASGLPVVGANAGAIGNLLATAPGAQRFDSHDPADLLRALGRARHALDQDRSPPGSSSSKAPVISQWVASRYSWTRTFETLFRCYAELRGESARAAPIASR